MNCLNDDNAPVSPMCKKIQELEEKIKGLSEQLTYIQDENESLKLGTASDNVHFNIRLTELESSKIHVDRFKLLSNIVERIKILEENKNYQIDDNRKSFRHLEELDERFNILNSTINNITDVREKLEEYLQRVNINYSNYKTIIERVETLEYNINKNNNDEKPHKCPICLGNTIVYIDPNKNLSIIESTYLKRDANGLPYNDCLACDKSGIIWFFPGKYY